MFNSITLGQYYNTKSKIHSLDPRVKLILTMFYMVIVFFAKNYIDYAILLVFVLITIKLSSVPFKYVLKSLKPMVMILAFTFILNAFFSTQGEIIFSFAFIKIRDASLMRAVYMALRLVFLIVGTSLMTLTTSPISLTYALESVFSPLKILRFPVHELAMMMSIALRFIPTLLEEANKIRKAQMARGAKFESKSIKEKALSIVPLLVPLFVSAFRRAEDLAFAMEARCYNGDNGRTRLNVPKFKIQDLFAILFVAFVWAMVFITK